MTASLPPPMLRRLAPKDVPERRLTAVDEATEAAASAIVACVRREGASALKKFMRRFDGWQPGSPLVFERADLDAALRALDPTKRAVLEHAAASIRTFAQAQLEAIRAIDINVPGGRAGHCILPIERVGCYAPAGRYPLPSSLLMSVVTARVAGVTDVTVATGHPMPIMLAAAAIADADRVLAAGGAHAIAALAWGVVVPACDLVVGPGNRWVTASKRGIAGHVAIDMLAGPSELLVVADATANPRWVAADLLAQAEHDADAVPVLVTTSAAVIAAVERELHLQLATLPTWATARASLGGGGGGKRGAAVLCQDDDDIVGVCNRFAPEHLHLCTANADALVARMRNAGAVFIGGQSAEVFGDYGIGGNHVLPTGGGARFTGGLSVYTFLRIRTWLRMQRPHDVATDVATLARIEGLEGHARAAIERVGRPP